MKHYQIFCILSTSLELLTIKKLKKHFSFLKEAFKLKIKKMNLVNQHKIGVMESKLSMGKHGDKKT